MKKIAFNKMLLIASSIVCTCLFSCTEQKKPTLPLEKAPQKQMNGCGCGQKKEEPKETTSTSLEPLTQNPATEKEEPQQNLSVTPILVEAIKRETPAQKEPVPAEQSTAQSDSKTLEATPADGLKTENQKDETAASGSITKE